ENKIDLFDLQIDQQVSSYLSETAKWAKFLAILGFIMCGLLVVVGFFASSLLTRFGNDGYASGMSIFFTIIYIVLAIVYFFPCLYLYHFANKMQRALRQNDQISLTDSFRNLKSCYKYMGILFIIIIGFYVLIFVGTLISTGSRF
ncbi:MAG: hypothetical protein H7Y31_01675, partial [Chitinophagaceae bacterium]|nr:hypothetical protein [Chitinophagaceae bacterium]